MPHYTFTFEDMRLRDAKDSRVRDSLGFERMQSQDLCSRPSAAKRQSTLLPDPMPKRQQTMNLYHSISKPGEFQSDPSISRRPRELPRSRYSAYVGDGFEGNVGGGIGEDTGEDTGEGIDGGTDDDIDEDIDEDISARSLLAS